MPSFLLFPVNFNSQPHKEADSNLCMQHFVSAISTHSLTRRLTTFTSVAAQTVAAFQLTASQGG